MPTKKYKIEWLERRTTTTGKQMAKVTLSDETGAQYTDIGVWADFPGFAELMPGSEVQGSIVEKGQYKTLYPVKQPSQGTTGGQGGGMRGVAAAQARKGDMIEKAQENKSNAIKVASAMRDASLFVTSINPNRFETDEEMWEAHKAYRTRYLAEWDAEEKKQDVPF